MKNKMPMLVGLCGRSGSGKGYVSEKFAEGGIPAIDTDAVYRTMTSPSDKLSPCMTELVKKFGSGIAKEDNSLDRAAMREIVFGDGESAKNALAELNRITHKHILAETKRIAREMCRDGNDIVLIDAPVLYESGFDKYCEAVIAVTAPEETVVRRIMRRDGVTKEAALARLKTQKPVAELTERADYVIVNDGDDEQMEKAIDKCAMSLREICAERKR